MELAAWLDGLSDDVIEKLAVWGIIDARQYRRRLPLDEQLSEWRDAVLDNGRTQAHADLLHQRATAVVEGCKFPTFGDIDPHDVMQFFNRRRAAHVRREKGARSFSAQSQKHYTRALKQFCRWMVNTGRATQSPLEALKIPSVDADRRYERRALKDDELRRLIQAANEGETYLRTTGAERAVIHALAATTGLAPPSAAARPAGDASNAVRSCRRR